MHKKPWLEPGCGVKTVLTRAPVLWHCRFSFETDREMEMLMPKAEWGVKRTCLGCGARFYDLKRDPIVCPKCEVEFEIVVAPKPRRAKPAAAAKAAVKAAAEKTENLIDDNDDSGDSGDSDNSGDSGDSDDSDDSDADDVIVAKVADNDVLLDDDADDGDEDLGDVKAVKASDDDLKGN